MKRKNNDKDNNGIRSPLIDGINTQATDINETNVADLHSMDVSNNDSSVNENSAIETSSVETSADEPSVVEPSVVEPSVSELPVENLPEEKVFEEENKPESASVADIDELPVEVAEEALPVESVVEEKVAEPLATPSSAQIKAKKKAEMAKINNEKKKAKAEEKATILSALDDIDPDFIADNLAPTVRTNKNRHIGDFTPNRIEPVVIDLAGSNHTSSDNGDVKFKKRVTPLSIAIMAVILVAVIAFSIFYDSGLKESFRSPLTINGQAVSSSEFSFMYHYIMIENGVDLLGSGTQEMLDSASDDTNYKTNRDYFLDQTAKELQTMQLLYDDAISNGFKIEDEHYDMARSYIDWLKTKANDIDVSLSTYISGIFGSQVDEQCIVNTLAKKYFTEDYASDAKLVQLQATEDQAQEAYSEDPNSYDVVSYKVLRITYEQRDAAFIATATTHANEIIEAMGHDASLFETAASEYFTGDDQARLMQPDSTLVSNARYSDFTHQDFRDWLFDAARTSGDTVIFNDEDGFPIILCFVSRDKQNEPLRSIRMVNVTANDDGSQTGFTLGDAQSLAQEIYDGISDEASMHQVENTYTDEILDGEVTVSQSTDTYSGKYDDAVNAWVFSADRAAGDKALIETDNGFCIVYFVSVSEKPEWYDRVNSFIRMNNYQAFLNEMITEYPYEFNQAGLDEIQDVP